MDNHNTKPTEITTSEFIPFADGCERLHISPRAMKQLIKRGLFPAPVRIHRQLRFWRASVFHGALAEYEATAEQNFR